MGVYHRPVSLEDALGTLSGTTCALLAGGTDFYPARVGEPLDDDILDLTALRELRGIDDRGDHWRIGALTRWSEIRRAALPPVFDGLKMAAAEVGGVQIQNAGTLAGNLCNASPAADGVPPLMAMDALLELASARGARVLPLAEFLTGARQTALEPDEIVTAILVPKPAEGTASTFLKLGARRYLVISIVMVAITLTRKDDAIGSVAISVGACSPVARRLTDLEAELVGASLAGDWTTLVSAERVEPAIAPIDDVRGSADYRRDVAVTLIRRGLAALVSGADATAGMGASA